MSLAAEVGVIASAVLGVCAVAGLVVRWGLLPYLREQLVKPVQETHRQVTPHDRPPGDAEPTIVDRLDDVQTTVSDLRTEVEAIAKKAQRNRELADAAGRAADAVHRRLSDHEAWSREEDSRLWRAISVARQGAEHDGKDKPQ